MNVGRRKCYPFLKNNNGIRKKEKYFCKNLKCKLEGIEYKVQNLDNSVDFYKNVLGFRVSEQGENFAKIMLGDNEAYIKLIQNSEENMLIGEAQVRRFWTNCFITDPDGYGIEVVLQEDDDHKLNRVFFCIDFAHCYRHFYIKPKFLDQTFYDVNKGFSKLVKIQSHLEEISYPWNIYGGMSYFFSSKKNSTMLQLAYAYDEDTLHMGNSLGNLIISFEDLNVVEKRLRENNIEINKCNDAFLVKDLDGYNVYLKLNK
ncbi:glyoxalase I, putative (GILP) [Plasmodium ovale wallikeri]|uniref:Glyoxalase I, putative (GILP) n=1 Tax=Plasmodium ovale wallikeri TaxID=864142 RepID=A0A1A8Z7F6_PLAOA|nr:glyoxalase I, putative (GILP) [Plasmodium ovale wallikeri]SBT39781.1 glyoxalase I, putative (GILP) [Plasmodium ovale wallikeri]